MQAAYHVEICQKALRSCFSPPALKVIIAANLGQDNLRGQIGRPEYHFDDSQFLQSLAYIRLQRRLIHQALAAGEPQAAWQAFGRLTHAGQDFYAHSNYVALWFEREQAKTAHPAVEDIPPLDPTLLHHPSLVSGHIYLPWEVLSYLPLLGSLMCRLLPADSHANMNLDKPQRGPLFAYAIVAARKRSEREFQVISDQILQNGGSSALQRFTGKDEKTD